MRILFFSDAHGNEYAVRAFFEKIENTPYDLMVYGGDFCGYYFGAESVIDLIRKRAGICLLGNHDKMTLDLIDGKADPEPLIKKYGDSYRFDQSLSDVSVEFLRSLKSIHRMECDGMKLVFVHGSIDDPIDGRIYPDAVIADRQDYEGISYVFCGHTHHKMIKRAGDCYIVNPGSIGQQRDGKGVSYVIFDTQTDELAFHTVDYDTKALSDEINKKESDEAMREKLTEAVFRKCIKKTITVK